MQIAFLRDNLHEMSSHIFWKKNKKNVSKCMLEFLPSMPSFKRGLFMMFISGSVLYWHVEP